MTIHLIRLHLAMLLMTSNPVLIASQHNLASSVLVYLRVSLDRNVDLSAGFL